MKPASVIHLSCRVLLASLLLPLSAIPAQAQNETNNWIFGRQAWLKFPGGIASPVSLSGAVINTGEGSASISDQAGNLLFSTDGRTVWNSSNVQMPNGFGLLGASSATQSALIVPWPNSECKKYFIFTVDDTGLGKQQQLNYSVVDMNATTGGGLGDVISKNVLLKKRVSEKLAAVRDSNGTGFWVVAHGFKQPSPTQSPPPENKEFYAYHVTSTTNGTNLVGTEITSSVGSAHQIAGGNHVLSTGQMKISPDGQLIACAVNTAFVEILKFNASSGQVTLPMTHFPASSAPFQRTSVYGLEFSPLSGFLYVTTITAPSELFQYNISSATWTSLQTGLATQADPYDFSQLQLGPDGRIYVARDTRQFVGVINSPDNSGVSCTFQGNGPSLSSGTSTAGLPTMIGGQFSCGPGPTITPSPAPTPTPPPPPTPTPTATPASPPTATATPTPTLQPTPTPTPTPPCNPTATCNPCCPPWGSVIWAAVVMFFLVSFREPIARFLGR